MSKIEEGLAFIFPGQGSQSVGMLSEYAVSYPHIEETFRSASDVVGYDLWGLVQNGPDERLNATEVTQPALLTAGVAIWRVWCEKTDIRPAWMAGHSLGEYTALVCGGALLFEEAVHLVAERARLMQEAVPAGWGAMAAILGLEDEQVVSLCEKASSTSALVVAANFNAPGQVVIAGHTPAVTHAIALAKEAGAKRSVLLPVSVPSHTPLMEPASKGFLPILEQTTITSPTIHVLHNVDVALHSAPEVIRSILCQQLTHPVRWSDSMRFLSHQGVTRFIECGPGRALMGLNKRIVPGGKVESLSDATCLVSIVQSFSN